MHQLTQKHMVKPDATSTTNIFSKWGIAQPRLQHIGDKHYTIVSPHSYPAYLTKAWWLIWWKAKQTLIRKNLRLITINTCWGGRSTIALSCQDLESWWTRRQRIIQWLHVADMAKSVFGVAGDQARRKPSCDSYITHILGTGSAVMKKMISWFNERRLFSVSRWVTIHLLQKWVWYTIKTGLLLHHWTQS